ncbi:MAG: segregation/condensation protein A [Planctomycetes bacterium]|nr:segregation/condensation protein A [Planctomycetota bacterium]
MIESMVADPETSIDDKQSANARSADLDLGYSVSLDSFAGPLDLLLYLVRRSEVDIVDIPLVEIADQFVATLQSWENMDLDVAGDFILMAASLLELKARMIVPPEADDIEEDEEALIDPRAELISQLLAYRKFKEASLVLQRLEEHNTLCHYRRIAEHIPDTQEEIDDFDLENADPYQLFSVWDTLMVIIEGKAGRTVVYDDVPIEQRAKLIIATMEKASEAELSWLFSGVETRIQRIGVFVAVLDCVRKTYIEAIQHEQFGSVYLRYRQDEERTAKPVLPEVLEDESGKKRRRRKRQLVTFQQSAEVLAAAEQLVIEETEEDSKPLETDEQIFLAELDGKTNVDELLLVGKDLEAAIQSALYEQGVIEIPAVEEQTDDAEGVDLDIVSEHGASVDSVDNQSDDENEDEDEYDDDDEDEECGDEEESDDSLEMSDVQAETDVLVQENGLDDSQVVKASDEVDDGDDDEEETDELDAEDDDEYDDDEEEYDDEESDAEDEDDA